MNHLFNLIKKELRELLTPATIIPMIVIVFIFASIGPLMNDQIEKASEPAAAGVMNADGDGAYALDAVTWIEEMNENAVMVSPDLLGNENTLKEEMKRAGINALIVIEQGYSDNIENSRKGKMFVYWYTENYGALSAISESSVAGLIAYVNMMTSEKLLEDNLLDPENVSAEFIMSPVSYGDDRSDNRIILNTGIFDGYTPSAISSALMTRNMFVSIVMMMIIVMIGSILVSSMGNEKENKTLETLLTLPVSRMTVVGGKIIGSAIVGLVFGALYLVGMYFMTGVGGSSIDLNALGLVLNVTDWLIVGAFLFMAIVCALGLCMILGAFAKNYKAAQTLIMPISILAMIPMMLTMFGSFGSYSTMLQAVIFAIPFSHPMMIMENLMFDNTAVVLGGIAYLAIFALATLLATIRLYRSDILLTGFIKKENKWTRSVKRKE